MIGARGVVPSVFYEWELPDRDDGVPKCEMRGVASYSLSDEGRAGRSSDTPHPPESP